jgi:hypothetical protein
MVVHACNTSTQEDHEFKASLGYMARLCLKTTITTTKNKTNFAFNDLPYTFHPVTGTQ